VVPINWNGHEWPGTNLSQCTLGIINSLWIRCVCLIAAYVFTEVGTCNGLQGKHVTFIKSVDTRIYSIMLFSLWVLYPRPWLCSKTSFIPHTSGTCFVERSILPTDKQFKSGLWWTNEIKCVYNTSQTIIYTAQCLLRPRCFRRWWNINFFLWEICSIQYSGERCWKILFGEYYSLYIYLCNQTSLYCGYFKLITSSIR
jgi:hypothetical protein